MHKLPLLIGGVLLSQAFVFGVQAQEPGAGTPKAAPYQKVSPEDKASGKAHRKEEGRAVAKSGSTTGEITPMPSPQAKVPKAERQEARAARKAETVRAAKAGELAPQGEVGAVK